MLPNSFAITQFHIVYMYHSSITVFSKISKEIVYGTPLTGKDGTPLMSISCDIRNNRLLVTSDQAPPLFIAYLEGEDTDAWRYYLRREQFE